jgi:glycerate 2-kinase
VRIVIAPDSFKGSIGAADAAQALAGGWHAVRPGDDVVLVPLADGGEGTLDVLAAAVAGARWHHDLVSGPDGRPVNCPWLELPGAIAVVELARASGLPLLATPDPLGANTSGLGEVIGRALDRGAHEIVITLGGSASTDGGTGALTALGARFLDAAGRALPPGGGALRDLAAADMSGLRRPPAGGVTCLADVAAPLLGPTGAAAVFGPQKGADPAQVARLDQGLARLAGLLGGDPAAAGAGAAGGTGYGFAAAWGARIRPGALELSQIAGLGQALRAADLVITGEGRYDRTSTSGKVAGAVFAAAVAAGVPVAIVAGQFADDPPPVTAAISLSELAGGPVAALAAPARWLRVAGQRLAGSADPAHGRGVRGPRPPGPDR